MVLLNILWPTFALVLLIFVLWTTTAVRRIVHLRRVPPAAGTFATRETTAAYFAPVELPANNLANLFEMPVLFFALVPLLLFTHAADAVQVALAWLFVVARAAHSYVHVAVRDVRRRFLIHVASNAILSAMWLGFFVDMVVAAAAFQHAATAGVQP